MELVDRLIKEGKSKDFVWQSEGGHETQLFTCIPGRPHYLHIIASGYLLHTAFAQYNPFLPRVVRKLAGHKFEQVPQRTLYILHQPLKQRKLRNVIAAISRGLSNFDPEQVFENFMQTYSSSPSCIYLFHNGSEKRKSVNDHPLPFLLGRQETVQEAMNYLKESPDNFSKLFLELTERYGKVSGLERRAVQDAASRENTDAIELYDSLQKPKYVRFDL